MILAVLPALTLPLLTSAPEEPRLELAVETFSEAESGELHVEVTPTLVQESDSLFPSATEDLAIAWPADGEKPTMLDVIVQYGRLTGQRISYQSDTESMLRTIRVPLDRPTTVPASEIQGFIESLMISSDFVMTIQRAADPRIVGVYSLQTAQRNMIRTRALPVKSNDVEMLRSHPAMLFTTAVDLPNTDVRQVSNSMRTMITDANTQQMIPAGNSNTMVITGYGPQVAAMIEQLELIDKSSKRKSPVGVSISHEVIRLEHGNAVELAPIVEEALATAQNIRSAAAMGQGMAQGPNSTKVRVLAVQRLNALVITCTFDQVAEAQMLVSKLDVASK